jgi:hypothetical protein
MTMTFGGGGASDNAFLIGPFLDWWDKRTAKRDAKRTKKLEARTAKREKSIDPETDGPTPSRRRR